MSTPDKDELYKDPPSLSKNTTDYDLPQGWGGFTDEQKSEWYLQERVFRQACQQDTAFGRRYRQQADETRGISLPEAWKRAKHGGYRK